MVKAKVIPPSKKRSTKITPITLKTNAELDTKRRNSCNMGVLKKSSNRYEMKRFTMQDWMQRRGLKKKVMDCIDFSRFLEDHNGGIEKATSASAWLTAFKKWRMLEGKALVDDDPGLQMINLQIKGKAYQGGAVLRDSPDVIDSGRLMNELVPSLLEKGQKMYAMAMIMIFYGAWRKTSAANLTVGDVRKGTDIGTIIVQKYQVKTDNARTVKNRSKPYTGYIKEMNNLTDYLDHLTKNKGPEEKLFPGFKDREANELIQTIAVEKGWGPGKWVLGSLRHGASREGRALVDDEPTVIEREEKVTVQLVKNRMGHGSAASQQWYQNSGAHKKRPQGSKPKK